MKGLVAAALLAALFASGSFAEDKLSQATFSMYCYWTGEATLGRIDGVRQTRIGHLAGHEVVEVTYDPSTASLGQLVTELKRQRSFYTIIARSDAAATSAKSVVADDEIERTHKEPHFIESKYTLRTRHPEIWNLGLTEEQAIALNSWAFFGGKMPDVLTAEQKRKLNAE